MSIKGFIEKSKKSFKSQVYITISCGKVPVYFLRIPFERVNVNTSKISAGITYSFSVRLLPLKFSKIINWGRWSEIEVVMLPVVYITISCGKVPVYFLRIPFERVNVNTSKISAGITYSFSVRLLPLKFSKIINWGRWSEIEVVILPERYLKDGFFTKMLSIQY